MCCVVHDLGTEFIDPDFQYILMWAGVKDLPTTVCNPQANAVGERLHQSFANILQILRSQNPPANVAKVGKLVDTAIVTSLYAAHSTIHRMLGLSPGGLVFHQDMLLYIPLLIDFQLIHDRRQVTIDENLR
jgi:hypothetical protein